MQINQDHQLPSFAEIAAAYSELQEPEIVSIVEEAEKIAKQHPVDATQGNPFAALDERFIRSMKSSGTVEKMKSFIRGHVNELVEVR